MSLEQLRATPLFSELEEADLARLAALAEPMHLEPGEVLIEEGTTGDAMFVVGRGELEVTKRSAGAEIPVARVGPGAIQGEMAALEQGPRTATVRAVTAADVLRIPYTAMRELLAASPDASIGIIRTVVGRLRSTEAMLRQREKLAGLGTLAAGLAHELNNPAAAISRSVAALEESVSARARAAGVLAADSERLSRLVGTVPASRAAALGGLDRADRIDEIADLLRSVGASDPDEAAGALADAGWSDAELAEALRGYGRGEIDAAITWLTSVAAAQALLGEVRMAAERISEIVGAVKSYSYLDQAPVQRVDLRQGLENTLVILSHKLKQGVSVQREYADDLPQIEGYGSELNQVWTNVIDNAIDAMGGSGDLLVRAEPADSGGARVTICDSGPGIPPEAQTKLFEPFYTTKEPGVGTGLGLHISHNVVVRHGGRIEVESRPGRTCFVVTLPATPPR